MYKRKTVHIWLSIGLIGWIAILNVFRYRLASRAEVISEAMMLLLILTSWLAPSRFRPVVWKAIVFALSVTILLIAWTAATHGTAMVLSEVVWAIIAICSLVQAFRELSKLRATPKIGTDEGDGLK